MQPTTGTPAQIKEWRTLALDPATDTPLYRSPRNGPADNTTPSRRGTDLFVHTAPSGRTYFYLWHWTQNANETNICQLTTAGSAIHFIREQVCEMLLVDPRGQGHHRKPGSSCNPRCAAGCPEDESYPLGKNGQKLETGLDHENLMRYLPGLYWHLDDEHET
jgi:hypothetical protein